MNFRVLSDLHLEFEDWKPTRPALYTDILILAGDIAPLNHKRLRPFLEWCADNHEHTIYVAGNHEFYHGQFPVGWDDLEVPAGVHKLEKQRIVIDGQGFCGATMWTDLCEPMDAHVARTSMNDYQVTYGAFGLLTVGETTEDHFKAVNFLKREVQPGDIVVTHHLPTYASVAKKYAGDALNCAFATENFELIEALKPAMWVHGHTHDPCDYRLGATRIVCNPKGYYNENFYFTRDGYVG
jgi:predicted phosphodiesterase